MRVPVIALVAGSLVAGCAGTPARAPVPPPVVASPAAGLSHAPDAAIGSRAAALAASLVGRPYRFGGASPEGFDCSGLVYYVYSALGLGVPRTAALQRGAAARVAADDLKPGDLVFFYTPQDHVGIYVGDGEFVHAPASGRSVQRARLDAPFFVLGFAGGGRLPAP